MKTVKELPKKSRHSVRAVEEHRDGRYDKETLKGTIRRLLRESKKLRGR